MNKANSPSHPHLRFSHHTVALGLIFSFLGLSHGWPQPVVAAETFTVAVHGHGNPVIFIPGLSCPGSVWDSTVTKLSGNYECHLITIAGFAGSPSSSANPILQKVRDELMSYIEENKFDRPVVVGHSLGGFLALWMAETVPHLLGKIVVVDAMPFLPAAWDPTATPESWRPQAEKIRTQIASENRDQFSEAQRSILATFITDPSQAEALAAVTSNSDPKVVAEAYYELLTTDLRPGLPSIECPAVLLNAPSTWEKFAPVDAINAHFRAEYSGVRQAEFVSFRKARHFVMYDEPERWLEVLKKALATGPVKS
jgi:N-formylmaleamate deformylase